MKASNFKLPSTSKENYSLKETEENPLLLMIHLHEVEYVQEFVYIVF